MLKRIFLSVFIVMFTCLNSIDIYAKEIPSFKCDVQIDYGYMFDDGSFDVFRSAPGVVINSNTVITYNFTAGDLSGLIDERLEGYKTLGINKDDILSHLSYVIYKGGDTYITVTESSCLPTDAGDVLLLKTEDVLDVPADLSPKSETNDEKIYATGFSNTEMDGSHFIKEDSTLKQEIKIVSEDASTIRFSIDSSECYTGGALINGYDEVYGLILQNDKGGTALSVNALKALLNENGIMFSEGEVIIPLDHGELHSVLGLAESIDFDKTEYTEDSKEKFFESYDNAKKVSEDENVSQQDIDEAVYRLRYSMDNLQVDDSLDYGLIMNITFIAVFVIVLIISVISVLRKGFVYRLVKGKEEPSGISRSVYIDDNTVIDEAPAAVPEKEEERPEVKARPVQTNTVQNYSGGYIFQNKWDVPENSDTSENVLKRDIRSNDEIIGVPYIIRVSTGDRILINKKQFSVGRDMDVNYRIPENISISKCHCRFFEAGGKWYIVDNNSSNNTIVNGNKVDPFESIEINDMAEIVLANEKFIFRLIEQETVLGEEQFQEVPDTGVLTSFDLIPDNNRNSQRRLPPAPQQEPSYSEILRDDVKTSKKVYTDPGTTVLTSNDTSDSIRTPYLMIKGKKIKLTQFPFSLGRGKDATYKYTNDSNVSREHIIITKDADRYYVRDNESANGTSLNNEPMDRLDDYILSNGDEIKIVDDVITFHV